MKLTAFLAALFLHSGLMPAAAQVYDSTGRWLGERTYPIRTPNSIRMSILTSIRKPTLTSIQEQIRTSIQMRTPTSTHLDFQMVNRRGRDRLGHWRLRGVVIA